MASWSFPWRILFFEWQRKDFSATRDSVCRQSNLKIVVIFSSSSLFHERRATYDRYQTNYIWLSGGYTVYFSTVFLHAATLQSSRSVKRSFSFIFVFRLSSTQDTHEGSVYSRCSKQKQKGKRSGSDTDRWLMDGACTHQRDWATSLERAFEGCTLHALARVHGRPTHARIYAYHTERERKIKREWPGKRVGSSITRVNAAFVSGLWPSLGDFSTSGTFGGQERVKGTFTSKQRRAFTSYQFNFKQSTKKKKNKKKMFNETLQNAMFKLALLFRIRFEARDREKKTNCFKTSLGRD